MNNKDIDVFVISYNRLSYLESIVTWLEKYGFTNIHIVDNASTYLPLLQYLEASKHELHRLEKNYGHLTVWDCGKFEDIINNKKYIVTDCDVLPVAECPNEVTEYFSEILDKYPSIAKVGFSLKIDDLPESNFSKEVILEWEGRFWKNKIGEGLFDASIDTTFALYRPGIYPSSKKWWKSIRTDFPYIARHLPWYSDSVLLTEEDNFYQNSLQNKSSFWGIVDAETLKKYNTDLLFELEKIYASRKWKILQIIYVSLNLFVLSKRFENRIGKKNTPPNGGADDLRTLQKFNKQLISELGSIKSSGGWKLLNFFNIDYFAKTKHM